MNLWILRLTVKNFGQSTANSWYISIVITRTFFFMINFFLRLIIEICQFFFGQRPIFLAEIFSIPTLESYLSAVNEAITEKKIDTILCRTKKRPWPSMEIVNIFSGVCTEEYWGKKWSKQQRKLKKLRNNLILSTKLIT